MKFLIFTFGVFLFLGCSGGGNTNISKQAAASSPSVAAPQNSPTDPPIVFKPRTLPPDANTKSAAPPAEDESKIFAKIKEKAAKAHPDDYSTQKYVYETQVEAYQYMKTIPASSLKAKIERDQPYDFSTQKYVYDKQTEDKEYMDSIAPSTLKSRIQKDHPNDYSTQKYVYDREMDAKEAMEKK